MDEAPKHWTSNKRNFDLKFRELIHTPVFQFVTSGVKTDFEQLEKAGLFELEDVVDHFDSVRITKEYEPSINYILKDEDMFKGEEDE